MTKQDMTNRLRHALAVVVTLLALVSSVSAATVTTFLEPGTDATQDFSLYGVYGPSKCWSTGSLPVASSATDQAHTGPRSLKITSVNNTGGATGCFSPLGVLSDTGSQVSIWVRFSNVAGANQQFLRVENATQNFVWAVQLNAASGKLSQGPSNNVTGSAVLGSNVWYHVSVSYYITSTTVYQFKVYVNGVLDSTSNDGNSGALALTGGSAISLYTVGCSACGVLAMWFDDFYIATGGASSSSPILATSASRRSGPTRMARPTASPPKSAREDQAMAPAIRRRSMSSR